MFLHIKIPTAFLSVLDLNVTASLSSFQAMECKAAGKPTCRSKIQFSTVMLLKRNIRSLIIEGWWKPCIQLRLPTTMGGKRSIRHQINRPSNMRFLGIRFLCFSGPLDSFSYRGLKHAVHSPPWLAFFRLPFFSRGLINSFIFRLPNSHMHKISDRI